MMKILLVEDNEGDQKLLIEAFSKAEPAEIIAVEDADEAIALLRDQKKALPNFILLDLNLPGRNGKELLSELKQDKKLKKIPVLILTSSNAFNDIRECYELGASCYLKKPMRFSELNTLVEAISQFWLKQVIYNNQKELGS